MQGWYAENKILMREIREEYWSDVSSLQIDLLFNTIPNNSQQRFWRNSQLLLKFIGGSSEPRLIRKIGTQKLENSYYLISWLTLKVWYSREWSIGKSIGTGFWNRFEHQEIDSYRYIIFDMCQGNKLLLIPASRASG